MKELTFLKTLDRAEIAYLKQLKLGLLALVHQDKTGAVKDVATLNGASESEPGFPVIVIDDSVLTPAHLEIFTRLFALKPLTWVTAKELAAGARWHRRSQFTVMLPDRSQDPQDLTPVPAKYIFAPADAFGKLHDWTFAENRMQEIDYTLSQLNTQKQTL